VGSLKDPRKRVTIAQIAKAAGVSPSTVSKVLNGNAEVSVSTRQRVQSLLSEQNYEPRASAQSGAPALIDLVFQELESPWPWRSYEGPWKLQLSAT
jgi:DNA-binding LacI/PurR family transcriptional regulator